MHVIGFCRFSYPAYGGFKQMHETIAEREAFLYAPERMEGRFRHFEALTLPSIRAQTDPDFTFLIQVGESLPAPYRARLDDLTASVPQVRILAQPPMKHREAAQLAILTEVDRVETETIQFRLDDDDAVGVDFVAQCRRLARQTERLRRRARFFALEFNHGYSVECSSEGIKAEKVTPPFWACGLAMITRPGERRTIMNYGHHKLHHEMPMIVQPKPDMFLRANHDTNDSAAKIKYHGLKPLDDEMRAHFKARFNVDEAAVAALFRA